MTLSKLAEFLDDKPVGTVIKLQLQGRSFYPADENTVFFPGSYEVEVEIKSIKKARVVLE